MIRIAVIADPHVHDCTWIPEGTSLPGAVRTFAETAASTRVFNESIPAFRAALDRVATRVQLPWVEVEAAAPMAFNLDGEPVEATGFRFDCVPRRVRMHLPADCPLLAQPPVAQ